MNKKYNILFVLLVITYCTLSLCLVINKVSYSSNNIESCNNTNNNMIGDFGQINKDIKFFDVSDFAQASPNTIDIASKVYSNNVISIADSNFKISDELLSNIYSTIQSYGSSSSFYLISLTDGMSIAYNIDRGYETASSIKAPYALYIYEEMDKGNINGDSLITYEQRFYNKGTGVVKKSDFGTSFSVRDLVYYSLYESDNVAHTMLHGNYGVNGYNNFLRNLGTKQLYLTAANPWGFTSARSAALIWQEIYNFSIRSELGIEFLNILSTAKYNYFKEVMPDIPSAGKAGFASYDVVETGIVFDEKPYIGVAIANRGGNIGAYSQVLKLISYMNDIMKEYYIYLETIS
ncbi:MAG TPA: hypothetical protein DCE23_06435 [Firmicutes bacterium]|nr:hypothetical protein [Bacillota bacterium]